MNKPLAVLLVLTATGCSNKAIYDNLQIHHRNQCLEELPPTHVDCVNLDRPSYEEYKRERESFLHRSKKN